MDVKTDYTVLYRPAELSDLVCQRRRSSLFQLTSEHNTDNLTGAVLAPLQLCAVLALLQLCAVLSVADLFYVILLILNLHLSDFQLWLQIVCCGMV